MPARASTRRVSCSARSRAAVVDNRWTRKTVPHPPLAPTASRLVAQLPPRSRHTIVWDTLATLLISSVNAPLQPRRPSPSARPTDGPYPTAGAGLAETGLTYFPRGAYAVVEVAPIRSQYRKATDLPNDPPAWRLADRRSGTARDPRDSASLSGSR